MFQFGGSDTNNGTKRGRDSADSNLHSKRTFVGRQTDSHIAEPLQQRPMNTPPLDKHRAESSRQHVRALNAQFASWVQTQLQNHPDELWEDGARDYLNHASTIMEKFSDVVNWLKANAPKAESLLDSGSKTGQQKLVYESKGNDVTLLPSKPPIAPASTTSGFAGSGMLFNAPTSTTAGSGTLFSTPSSTNAGLAPHFGITATTNAASGNLFSFTSTSANAGSTDLFSKPATTNAGPTYLFSSTSANAGSSSLFSMSTSANAGSTSLFGTSTSGNAGSTSLFGTSTSANAGSGAFFSIPAPLSFGSQNSVPLNRDTSNDADGDDDIEQPSSPSVKKTEEIGIIIVHEVKCKLYVKSRDPADKDTWKDKGAGQLSIKCKEGICKGTKDSKPTIIVRNDVGKVLLNALLYPGIKTSLQKNSVVAIFHTAEDSGNDGGNKAVARTFLIKTKSEEDRNKLAAAIQEHAPAA